MNLISDRWIPVIRQNGLDKIRPWQITEVENPVLELNAPRPDFQGALYQLLIGLLQTCFAPEDEGEWLALWTKMPLPGKLEKAFNNFQDAFDLDISKRAAFMQDHEDFEGEWLPIEDLIGGALSDNTRKGNKDLFVKTGQVKLVSPYWAALALFNLQVTGVLAWGKHRVGLRGNAPLTTILIPDAEHNTLWEKLWLNVIYREDMDLVPGNPEKGHGADIFPWMGKTRTSPNKEPTSPSDAHPLQHYWAMPRRIRLRIEPVNGGQCDLSGEFLEHGVECYKRIHNGVYYTNGWQHPITPYTRAAKDKFPKPIEGRIAGEGFRHWVSLNYDENTDEKNKKMRWGRALIVRHYYEVKPRITQPTLWCFGYDAESAKVKCWYESTMPTFRIAKEDVEALKSHASEVLKLAYIMIEDLRFSLIRAWFKPQKDSRGKEKWSHITKAINKAGSLSTYKKIEYDYWDYLGKYFPDIIKRLIAYGQTPGRPFEIYANWLEIIRTHCLIYFDRYALSEAVDQMNLKRVVDAKNYLLSALYDQKKPLLKAINDFKKQMEVAG